MFGVQKVLWCFLFDIYCRFYFFSCIAPTNLNDGVSSLLHLSSFYIFSKYFVVVSFVVRSICTVIWNLGLRVLHDKLQLFKSIPLTATRSKEGSKKNVDKCNDWLQQTKRYEIYAIINEVVNVIVIYQTLQLKVSHLKPHIK